jgi:hypothetical protein
MACQIQNGALLCPPRFFSEKFCQFPLDRVHNTFCNDPEKFCGLIVLKATGKTATLKYLVSQEKNCVFCKVTRNQLVDILYARLEKSIWILPWFLQQICFNGCLSKHDIIREVFKLVKKN